MIRNLSATKEPNFLTITSKRTISKYDITVARVQAKVTCEYGTFDKSNDKEKKSNMKTTIITGIR